MRCRWIASVLLLTCASGERIERAQARPARAVRASMREALQSTEDTETPRKGKVKYVEEKLKIEREVVAPFVAKAKTIPAADTSAKQKLAFIFLTMRELQWHSLWERFFQDAPVGEYSIYIHQASATPAKSNMTLPLRRFGALQVPWVRTAWCALFGVEVATLFAALKDPTNAQFVFLSDSTVPLKNFAYVHQELMQVAPSSSKVCLAEPATFHYVKAEVLKQEASRSCVFRDFYRAYNPRTMKHHQWLTLARRHAEQVVVHAEAALDIYQASWIQAGPDLDVGEGCSDESAPLTALLASLQVEGKSSGNTWTDLTRLGIEQDCLTYVRWRNCFSGTELDLNSGAVADFSTALSNIGDVRDLLFQDNFDFLKSNIKRELNGFPHYFSNITESYLWSMVKQGFMFARKLAPGIQVQMNGREHVEPVHGWLNFLGVGSSEPKSVKHEPLETLLPRMWSEINASEARQLSWRHLEVSGKPLPLEKP